jgi:hypothetical protein
MNKRTGIVFGLRYGVIRVEFQLVTVIMANDGFHGFIDKSQDGAKGSNSPSLFTHLHYQVKFEYKWNI